MIRTELDLQPIMPFTRVTAARLAAAASRFDSRLTLECEGLVLNMKSMLGLLSQAKLPEGRATLVADGPDEVIATQALLNAVGDHRAQPDPPGTAARSYPDFPCPAARDVTPGFCRGPVG